MQDRGEFVSGDGFRRGFGHQDFGGVHQPPYPGRQPPSREEIIMQAGRMAAEYLVSRGSLSPDALAMADMGYERRRLDDGYHSMGRSDQWRGRRGSGGYMPQWSSIGRGRVGQGTERRNLDTVEEEQDEFPPGYPRLQPSGLEEMGSSSVWRGGSDEGQELGLEGNEIEKAYDNEWKASSSSKAETNVNKMVDGVKETNLEIRDEVRSDVSGYKNNKQKNMKEEVTDVQPSSVEGDPVNRNGGLLPLGYLDGVKETNLDVRSDVSGGFKNNEEKNMKEDDTDVQASTVEGDPVNRNGGLLPLGCFLKVPTKPRSSIAQRRVRLDQDNANKFQVASAGASQVNAGEESIKDSLSDSRMDQTNIFECQVPEISATLPVQSMEEYGDTQHESNDCPPSFGPSSTMVDAREVGNFAHFTDQMEFTETQRDSIALSISLKNAHSLQELGEIKSSPERLSMDEERVKAVDQEKSMGADDGLFPNAEPEFDAKLEEEKRLLPALFDLNLIGTPEITENPDDPVLDHRRTSAPILEEAEKLRGLSVGDSTKGSGDFSRFLPTSFDLNLIGTPEITENTDDPLLSHRHTSVPILEDAEKLRVNIGLSVCDSTKGSGDYSRFLPASFDLNLIGTPEITENPDDPLLNHHQTSAPILDVEELQVEISLSVGDSTKAAVHYSRLCDGKLIPVTNLEHDSPVACDTSKLESEMMYSSPGNFLSHTEDADPFGKQDVFSLAIPKFLGTDMSCCPSLLPDLNSPQMEISLNDAGGVPGDIDSTYASRGEISMSSIGLWDRLPRDYIKFL